MKCFLSNARFQSRTYTVALVAVGTLATVVFSGCSKKQPPAAAVTQTDVQSSNPAANPVYNRPVTPTVVTAANDGEPDLKQMTHSLRSWIARTHIVPKNFEDFVAQANMQFSPAPAGKKYVIGKHMVIQLANQ
ncbi:MAG TPA: hypothetical protein VG347_06980 [Verrucomicrobiae bacterium]|nr:hypothetical protein [Verrucomicrobiae bacterium]